MSLHGGSNKSADTLTKWRPAWAETRRKRMNTTDSFTVLDAKTSKEISLAMEELWLKGKILPVGAHLLVFHHFRSDEDRPLELVYSFGLPRDAVLRRFSVRGEGFQVRSELKPVDEAKQAYEKGIQEASLLLGHSPTSGDAPSSRLARTENRRNKRGRIYETGYLEGRLSSLSRFHR